MHRKTKKNRKYVQEIRPNCTFGWKWIGIVGFIDMLFNFIVKKVVMKKIITCLLLIIIECLLIYLLFALMGFEFDTSKWDVGAKTVALTLQFLAIGLTIIGTISGVFKD